MGVELELRGVPIEISDRKVIVEISVGAAGRIRANGRVVAVLMPERMAGNG